MGDVILLLLGVLIGWRFGAFIDGWDSGARQGLPVLTCLGRGVLAVFGIG